METVQSVEGLCFGSIGPMYRRLSSASHNLSLTSSLEDKLCIIFLFWATFGYERRLSNFIVIG